MDPALFDDTGAPALAALPAHGRSHHGDPETSREAAVRVDAKSDRGLVLHALAGGPLTDFELGERIGRRATSAGTRRGELVKAGLVCWAECWGVSPSGNRARRWRLTEAGRRLARSVTA